MNALTHEWVDKAEADGATARREAAVVVQPNHDAVCFHAQQCLEKYLKAILQESGTQVPRTHDLVGLLNLVLPLAPQLQAFQPDLLYLTSFAVEFRYPGNSADQADAQRSVSTMETVRISVRQVLGLV